MLKFLAAKWAEWGEEGIYFPFAYDPEQKKASVTLLQVYISAFLTAASLIALHFKPTLWPATAGCMLWWALSFVFYRMRKLDKVKFNLEEKSLELDADTDAEKTE